MQKRKFVVSCKDAARLTFSEEALVLLLSSYAPKEVLPEQGNTKIKELYIWQLKALRAGVGRWEAQVPASDNITAQ